MHVTEYLSYRKHPHRGLAAIIAATALFSIVLAEPETAAAQSKYEEYGNQDTVIDGEYDDGWQAYDSGDYARALRVWERLADQGDAQAQNNLGYMYKTGLGTPVNYQRAIYWYELAADQGRVEAIYDLAIMYDEGLGVTRDYEEARWLYERAAREGFADAHNNLGVIYANGNGVQTDARAAYFHYALAARIGTTDLARENRDNIRDRLSISELNRLDRLIGDSRDTDLFSDHVVAFEDGSFGSNTYASNTYGSNAGNSIYGANDKLTDHYGAVPQPTGPWDDPDMSRQDIRELQDVLTYLGYEPGPIDGIIGERTREAVRQFESDMGWEVTGAITFNTLLDANDIAFESGPIRTTDNSASPFPEGADKGQTAETIVVVPTEDSAVADDQGVDVVVVEEPDPDIIVVEPDPVTVEPLALDVPEHLSGTDPTLTLDGRVTGGADGPITLLIDGHYVEVAEDGSFSHDGLYVVDGERQVLVTAIDSNGNQISSLVMLERQRVVPEPFDALELELRPLNPTQAAPRPNPTAVALIIGMEEYRDLPSALFAERDAKAFADYAEHALGVPPSRIRSLIGEDATFGEIQRALQLWLPAMVYPESTDIYIYFAGHGMQDPAQEGTYLIPFDGDAQLLDRLALNRDEVLQDLADLNARSVTVMLDTCFSGQGRSDELLVAGRPVYSVQTSAVPVGVTVISAATGQQIAGSLPDQRHGLFSYFMMRGLEGAADENTDGILTAGELSDWVRDNVSRASGLLGRQPQTPGIEGDREAVLARY